MFHNTSRKIAVTLAILVAFQGLSAIPASAQRTMPLNAHSLQISTQLQKTDTVASGLQAYDDSPLGSRIPLILVHGIGAKDGDLFNWDNFLTYAGKNLNFSRKYKMYLYHYDSTRSVPDISRNLQTELKGFIGALGGRHVKILAYSEGGLLTRNAMQDQYIDDNTLEVLTIATPFHGSPLANPEWLRKQVATESPFNVIRMTQKLAYSITGKLYPTFKEDFHWDNFDGALPAEQAGSNSEPTTQKNYALAHKKNFITYGSYFGKDVDASVIVKELNLNAAPPQETPKVGNLFRKNILFSLIRNNIGRLPQAGRILHPESSEQSGPVASDSDAQKGNMAATDANLIHVAGFAAPTDTPPEPVTGISSLQMMVKTSPVDLNTLNQARAGSAGTQAAIATISPAISNAAGQVNTPVSMMMYNDGISPISSQLWLGRYTHSLIGVAQPVEKLWAALRGLKGNPGTRLFPGMDHRNWMDGETRTSSDKVPDLLNPDEPPRTVFEWIIYDLMS